MEWQGHKEQYFGHLSWSQHGEDLFIASLFQLMGKDKIKYLDLGAHHPEEISNTALLYHRGSSGVNIEANPNLMAAFKRFRPRDLNVQVGVGPMRTYAKLLMYDDTNGRNTFSHEEFDKDRVPKKEIKVEIITIHDIIHQFCNDQWPDFVNIDLEGWDYNVLKMIDHRFGQLPSVFCIEIRKDDSRRFKEILAGLNFFCILDDAILDP